MHQTINGWTKEKMKEQIRLKNNGTRAIRIFPVKNGIKQSKCVLRADDGNACAVGCFIPDEKYRSEMEFAALNLFRYYPELVINMPLDERGLIVMQGVHDNSPDNGVHDNLFEWIDRNVADQEYEGNK